MSSIYGYNTFYNSDETPKVYLSEVQQLKLAIQELSDQNRTLSAQNSELNSKCITFARIEAQNRQLEDTIKEKNEKITSLEEEKVLLEKSKTNALRETELKYFKEVTYLKNQQENNLQKIETANVIVKLNDKQYARILELEKEIENITNHENQVAKESEIRHENQFTNLKKKMMDHIKTAQKNMAQSNLDNLDLNTKLSKLTTNQLLIELEEQSVQIEELLKAKEKYEKEIFSLKTDLNTHKRVEQLLQEKNKRYLDIVKNCDKKLSKETNDNANEKNVISEKINKNYEKLYKKQNKEYQTMKEAYSNLKEKEANYETKFKNIINLYKMAIDDLVNDQEFKNTKDVYVNIDEIKKGNFDSFSKQEKYSILVYLLKNILPLVNTDEDEDINALKEQFEKVEINNKTRTNFNLTNKNFHHYSQSNNNKKYQINNKTFTKFPKIEHLYIDSQRKKPNVLYRFLTMK